MAPPLLLPPSSSLLGEGNEPQLHITSQVLAPSSAEDTVLCPFFLYFIFFIFQFFIKV